MNVWPRQFRLKKREQKKSKQVYVLLSYSRDEDFRIHAIYKNGHNSYVGLMRMSTTMSLCRSPHILKFKYHSKELQPKMHVAINWITNKIIGIYDSPDAAYTALLRTKLPKMESPFDPYDPHNSAYSILTMRIHDFRAP